MKKLTVEDIEMMLSQASTEEDFQQQVLANLELYSWWGWNARNAILQLYHSKDNKHYISECAKLQNSAFSIASALFPGPVATYGRKKSYLSYLKKLPDYDDPKSLSDHHAFRLIIDDRFLGLEKGTEYLYKVFLAVYQTFRAEGLLFSPLRTEEELRKEKATHDKLVKDFHGEIFIPETVPPEVMGLRALFKDRVYCPKSNGFQGLSTIVYQGFFPVELQFWTVTQAINNEYGTASHDGYKPTDKIDEIVRERGFLELNTSQAVGDVLIKDTPRASFPREEALPTKILQASQL